jgi:hypothetical protein
VRATVSPNTPPHDTIGNFTVSFQMNFALTTSTILAKVEEIHIDHPIGESKWIIAHLFQSLQRVFHTTVCSKAIALNNLLRYNAG